MTAAAVVYILCALTSLTCAILLLRGWRCSRARLLLWSGLCFAGLSVNNALLLVDMIFIPDRDLGLLRNLVGLISVSLLLFGLIWEAE